MRRATIKGTLQPSEIQLDQWASPQEGPEPVSTMRGTDSTWVGSAAVSMTRLMTGRVAATCAWGTSNTSSSCTCVCVQHHCAGEMDGRLMAAGQERKACCHLRQLAGRASVKLPKTELLQLLMAVVGSSSRRVLGIFNVRRCAAGGGRKRVQAHCMWVTRARTLHVRDLRSCAAWQCMRGATGRQPVAPSQKLEQSHNAANS